MDPFDRPKLPATVYQSIESARIKIDEHYWKRLMSFQVSTTAANVVRLGFPDVKPEPPKGKRPDALRAAIVRYARNLFAIEAARYPTNDDLEHFLTRLGERTVEQVARTITSVEKAGNTVFRQASLAYHGLTEEQMRESATEEIRSLIEGRLDQLREHQRLPSQLAPRPESAASGVNGGTEPVSVQIERLKAECDISAEKIAGALRLDPRSIYKHLAGKAIPRRDHVTGYEEMFSELLGRPVRLKVQRKVRKKSQSVKGQKKVSKKVRK